MNGVETLAALLAIQPDLRAILSSGETEATCLGGKTLGCYAFLGKPYGLQGLDAAVTRAMG